MPQIFNLKALAQAQMTSSKKTKSTRRDSGVDDASPLLRMFDTATRWLAANAPYVDSLNVFPVPDGDTGTNMLFTIRAAYKAAEECPDPTLGPQARALAWGALMEARGNSGVILSQILRGFADGIDGAGELDGQTLARSLSLATESAYKGVESPVEGTMLTVIKDTARAAETAANAGGNLEDVLSNAVREAEASVLRTLDLLPVLKEAGVVDAGGQGVFLILEGALKGLTNQPLGKRPLHWMEMQLPGCLWWGAVNPLTKSTATAHSSLSGARGWTRRKSGRRSAGPASRPWWWEKRSWSASTHTASPQMRL